MEILNTDEGNLKSDSSVDRLGAFASTACALHCALCALMPTILAAMGLSFLISHEVEWLFTGVAVSLGLIALHLGWRQHGSRLVVSTLAILQSLGALPYWLAKQVCHFSRAERRHLPVVPLT